MASTVVIKRDVDYELTRFVRRLRLRVLEGLPEIHPQLDYGTFLFLMAICDAGDAVRATDIAEQLGVHKSTASRAVSALMQMGLVSRVPDPADGRAQHLIADQDARARLEAFRDRGHDWLSVILSDWDPEETAAFARSLGRLNDAAEQTV